MQPHSATVIEAERCDDRAGKKRDLLNRKIFQPLPLIDDASSVAPDLLRGASQIAAFLYGSATDRKKVYHLVDTARLPVFRLGSLLCARRSVLLGWIEEQETRGREGR